MTKSVYIKFRDKYEQEKSLGLLFVSYHNFTGDWNKDKRKFIRMRIKEAKLFYMPKINPRR